MGYQEDDRPRDRQKTSDHYENLHGFYPTRKEQDYPEKYDEACQEIHEKNFKLDGLEHATQLSQAIVHSAHVYKVRVTGSTFRININLPPCHCIYGDDGHDPNYCSKNPEKSV